MRCRRRCGVRKSKSGLTAIATIEARTAYGSERKAGVSATSATSTTRLVNSPCSGVHSGPPQMVTIRAERESEPAAGYARKHEPTMLAAPKARSSWLPSER